MKFPRNNKELHQIFLSSSTPQIQELEGEYLVDMLTLPASRRLFPDSKIFYSEAGKAVGHNRLFKTLTWGEILVKFSRRNWIKISLVSVSFWFFKGKGLEGAWLFWEF